MLTVICFSKDRPLQLQAYLESLMHFSGIKEHYITVIFRDSNLISYDRLIDEYPGINWVREHNFSDDLDHAISSAENFVLFGCDDVFFKSAFDLNYCLKTLQENSSLYAFSLRMGTNITGIPDFQVDKYHLIWDWSKTGNPGWNYPWEVSGSIYRKSDVKKYRNYVGKCSNPNLFEDLFYKKIYPKNNILLQIQVAGKLACFNISKCLTLTVNRVQDEFLNDFDASLPTDILSLYRCFKQGQRLSWESFIDCRNNVVHVGSKYFKLTNDKKLEPPHFLETNLNSKSDKFKINWTIRMKIVFYKLYIPFKERIRPFIPRTIIQRLRLMFR